jgi:hypothetical protein
VVTRTEYSWSVCAEALVEAHRRSANRVLTR